MLKRETRKEIEDSVGEEIPRKRKKRMKKRMIEERKGCFARQCERESHRNSWERDRQTQTRRLFQRMGQKTKVIQRTERNQWSWFGGSVVEPFVDLTFLRCSPERSS